MKQTASLARQRLIACECFSGSENNSDASFMLRLVLEANVCHSPCEQDASSIETPGARRGNRATSVQAGLFLLHDSSFHGNDIHWFCTGYQLSVSLRVFCILSFVPQHYHLPFPGANLHLYLRVPDALAVGKVLWRSSNCASVTLISLRLRSAELQQLNQHLLTLIFLSCADPEP